MNNLKAELCVPFQTPSWLFRIELLSMPFDSSVSSIHSSHSQLWNSFMPSPYSSHIAKVKWYALWENGPNVAVCAFVIMSGVRDPRGTYIVARALRMTWFLQVQCLSKYKGPWCEQNMLLWLKGLMRSMPHLVIRLQQSVELAQLGGRKDWEWSWEATDRSLGFSTR